MIVSYQGDLSFRISQGDLSLETNPKNQRFKADISLFSTGRPDSDMSSFVITGPGEYEIKDVTVKGFLSETAYNGSKLNTVYLMNFDTINFCFLGALSNPALGTSTLEALEDVDVLFVPVGGEGVLDPEAAYKLAVSIEPKLIIPMHYDEKSLKRFLKEGGEDAPETLDKLVIKKKDLEGKEGDIIILKEE